MADSHQDAGERASAIVELLPYEQVGSECSVTRIEQPSENPQFREHERIAKQVGISVRLEASETGVDEGGFEKESFE